MNTILFLMTGSDTWTLNDGTAHRTGFWAEEAVTPLQIFKGAGYAVQVATPGGVVPPVDPASLTDDISVDQPELKAPIAIADVDLAHYAAVFVPGGHGPMEDLAVDADSGRLLADAVTSGKLVGVVCHGPAALLAAKNADGSNALAGYTITAFTNAEEKIGGLAHKAPWLLQDRLAEAGLTVEVGAPFQPHTVTDRNVLTGQNPASSAPLAENILEALK